MYIIERMNMNISFKIFEQAEAEADNDQSDLLVEILNFSKQVKPKSLEKRKT